VAEIQAELLGRIRPAIQEIWPSSDAPIQDFDVVLGASGIVIDLRYQAAKDLGDVPLNMVLRSLQTKLGMQDLTLKAERIRPASAAGTRAGASAKRKQQ
jgi:hypothetical protein